MMIKGNPTKYKNAKKKPFQIQKIKTVRYYDQKKIAEI